MLMNTAFLVFLCILQQPDQLQTHFDCLAMGAVQIVTPGVYITVPPDEDAEDEQGAAIAAAGAHAAATGGQNPLHSSACCAEGGGRSLHTSFWAVSVNKNSAERNDALGMMIHVLRVW